MISRQRVRLLNRNESVRERENQIKWITIDISKHNGKNSCNRNHLIRHYRIVTNISIDKYIYYTSVAHANTSSLVLVLINLLNEYILNSTVNERVNENEHCFAGTETEYGKRQWCPYARCICQNKTATAL